MEKKEHEKIFAISDRMHEPKLTFKNWIVYFLVALLVTAIPCYLFHSVKDLEVQENIPLYCSVFVGTALLLTVAYHASAVYGSRIYKERSDVLSKTWSDADVDKKVNAVLAMGRIFAFAVVNGIYVLSVFILS